MKDIEKLLENTYYPDLDSLEAASQGFQPNTTLKPEMEEITSIGYDFESNFIGINQNNGNNYEFLIAVKEDEQSSYTGCQNYEGQETVFWVFEPENSNWLQNNKLQETNNSPKSMLGIDLSDLDTLKEDYQRQKREYFN